MCIKKFRILIFVLSPVYMIGKTAADSFCIKIFFFTDSPLLILKSIYKIYNDWYMYYQFISFLFWQQYRRAKFPSIVNCSSWDKTFDFRIISNLILSYNITFLFLCGSRGRFVNQQWSAVFFIVFQGSGNTSWQWDLGAIRKSLGFSRRYTGVLLPDSHPLPTHANLKHYIDSQFYWICWQS